MATTLLLDTHALLWWLSGDRRMPRPARERIADADQLAVASAASAWEIAIKRAIGKLSAPDDLLEVVEKSGLAWIPIGEREAYEAGSLPMHHRDPFDRLLIAQARSRSATLVSSDPIFDRYGVSRLWSG
jgi:PIN domain nuclease of toxin-antitoxin system